MSANGAEVTKVLGKKTPRESAAFVFTNNVSAYLEIERLNMRSIFSLVASTAA
jgi:hypothetical protein